MRDVREALALPPADPDAVRRFGPPTYSEEQVRAYAATIQEPLAVALGEAIELLERSLRFRGGGWECTEEELLGDLRATLAKAVRS